MSKFIVIGEWKMKKLDLAYMAGIFDGEGCIYITRMKPRKGTTIPRYSLVCNLAMCNPYIPKLFHFAFGGYFFMTPAKENRQSFWKWQVSAKQSIPFLNTIRQYLRLKKAEADLALEFQKAKRHGASLGDCGFSGKTEKELAIEEAQHITMSKLKIKSRVED